MNRLFRRKRRKQVIPANSDIPNRLRTKIPNPLQLEPLEHRLLLTTLTLPAGTTSETIFRYADPEENEPGSDVDAYNEIRIGTLSGMGPSKDVTVEILSYRGEDIPGTLIVDGNSVDVGGGPGGVNIISQIPTGINGLGDLGWSVFALATTPGGITYGISQDGSLVRMNTTTGTASFIGIVQDAINSYGNTYSYEQFEAADFDPTTPNILYAVVNGPTGIGADGTEVGRGSILIQINIITGEADPAGINVLGQRDYGSSRVTFTGRDLPINTIVYDESRSSLNNPVFLGYADDPVEDNDDYFVSIALNASTSSPAKTASTSTILAVEDGVIEGLMFDDQGFLFGLLGGEDNRLVYVNLQPGEEEPYIDVVDYGNNGFDQQIRLAGMSYDFVNNVGYATDPYSNTLYSINTHSLDQVFSPEGEMSFVIAGGLADVYLMYVASTTADVYITFTYVTFDEDEGWQYESQGGETAYLYYDADADSEVTTPDDAGGVMIGTTPVIIEDDERWAPTTFFAPNELAIFDPGPHGVYPGGLFRPGIVVADTAAGDPEGAGKPQDIGKIQVGGGVFGDVEISGSVGTFYTGYLGTNRINVQGDIDTLAVLTQAGGIIDGAGAWIPVNSQAVWIDAYWDENIALDPIMNVWGEMSSFYGGGSWGLPIRVHGDSDAPSFPGLLDPSVSDTSLGAYGEIYVDATREIERKVNDADDNAWFPRGALDIEGTEEEWLITNDSPYVAQYVGSADGTIKVIGQTEGSFDPEDYYSFGVMAGQTISIQLYYTGGTSNYITGQPGNPASTVILNDEAIYKLFDPSLNLAGVSGNADAAMGTPLPLEFTAEEAGIYTVCVGGWWTGFTYRLEITGTSPMTLGGGNVIEDIRDAATYGAGNSPVVQVVSGNMGALSAGGILMSADVQVNTGNLAALRAGANALPAGDLNISINLDVAGDTFHFNGEDLAPPVSTPSVGFGLEILDAEHNHSSNLVQIQVGGTIGMISSDVNSMAEIFAGGNIQSVRIGGIVTASQPATDENADPFAEDITTPTANFMGLIVANRNIGEISINGDYGPGFSQLATYGYENISEIHGIFANADGVGEAGIIDSILINGRLGESYGYETEIPVSTGHNPTGGAVGGNVRFVDIRGNIVISNAGWYEESDHGFGPFAFGAGQSVEIVDDSGAIITVAPGSRTQITEDYIFVPGQDPPTGTGGGELTIKLLPVRHQTYDEYVATGGYYNMFRYGYAISKIVSTDGLVVSAEGGDVEIGVVQAAGRQSDTVRFQGNRKISVLRVMVSAPIASETTGTTTPGAGQAQEEPLPDTGIRRILNDTGGDIVSIQVGVTDGAAPGADVGGTPTDGTGAGTPGQGQTDVTGIAALELVRIDGSLGFTASTTGQIIRSAALNVVTEIGSNDVGDDTVNADPGGTQWVGLVSSVPVVKIEVTGALGDVDVRGDVNKIIINSDNSRDVGQFDGVIGPIIVYGDLDSIELGDGIPSPGTIRFAQAGVFVYGTLGKATLSGAGRVIGGPIFAGESIHQILVSGGAGIVGYTANYSWVGDGERVRGAFIIPSTISVTPTFDDYILPCPSVVNSGSIDLVKVTGQGGEIREATIRALKIESIQVTGGANGIFDSRIYGISSHLLNEGTIGTIKVEGEGIHNTVIGTHRYLGSVTVAAGGTIEDSEISCTYEIGKITADQINRTDISSLNKLDQVIAKESIYDVEIEAGELGTLKSGGDLLGSAVYAAGPVKLITAKGDLISTIEVTGPYGDLKKLQAGGDIGTRTGGMISVDGQVGCIQAGGDFLADLYLNWDPTPAGPDNPQGPHVIQPGRSGYELGSLKAGGKILGLTNIGGDVKKIQCGGEFGIFQTRVGIYGNLDCLTVGSKKVKGDLESSLFVDGNLGKVSVYGNVNGKIDVTRTLNSLTIYGTKDVPSSLNASITAGTAIRKLVYVNATQALYDVVDGSILTITPVPDNIKE